VTFDTILAALCGAGFVAAGACLTPRHWRGETDLDGSRHPAWWPLGATVWRGVVRSAAVWWPLTGLMFLGSALAYGARPGSTLETVGWVVAAVAVLAGLAAHVPILLYNRPRRLVPPHLRDEPGALAEWRARRRGVEHGER
jgi:hypothetical protein